MDATTIIAKRIAQELRDGMLVNLGIGIPTLVANYVPAHIRVYFQSENGLIGTGPIPEHGMEHPMLTDAGGRQGEDRQDMRSAADLDQAGGSRGERDGGDRVPGRPRNAHRNRAGRDRRVSVAGACRTSSRAPRPNRRRVNGRS